MTQYAIVIYLIAVWEHSLSKGAKTLNTTEAKNIYHSQHPSNNYLTGTYQIDLRYMLGWCCTFRVERVARIHRVYCGNPCKKIWGPLFNGDIHLPSAAEVTADVAWIVRTGYEHSWKQDVWGVNLTSCQLKSKPAQWRRERTSLEWWWWVGLPPDSGNPGGRHPHRFLCRLEHRWSVSIHIRSLDATEATRTTPIDRD